ncbi:MAG: hypothetical protein AAB250_14275, partial [Bdellovibrionota bacterium]
MMTATMNGLKTSIALLGVVLLLSGFGFSKKAKSWKDYSFTEKDLRRQPANVEMPSTLWEKMESFARSTGSLAADAEVATEFVSLNAYLIEKNRGILGRENFALKFPVGGGEVDLGDFIQPLKGSFYFVTDFLPELDAKV